MAANKLKFLPSTSYDKVEKLLVDDNNFQVTEEIIEEVELLYFGKDEVSKAVVELKKLGIIREIRT
ncbi:MAG: hypothetical protein GPJ54_03040 [Candidatus Heimdallarchaeota archaeon]|nr:hypothetical protein [Candidatus Heimdallarchaeota archaeon]